MHKWKGEIRAYFSQIGQGVVAECTKNQRILNRKFDRVESEAQRRQNQSTCATRSGAGEAKRADLRRFL